MDKEHRLLVINVGSTSTKVACFKGGEPVALETIRYSSEALASFSTLGDQLPFREEDVLNFLDKNGIRLEEIDMVVSRGGLGNPAPAGAYRIDETMCRDLLEGEIRKTSLGPGAGHGPGFFETIRHAGHRHRSAQHG